MGYRYDLFVSYAHDKKGGKKIIKQWLDELFLPLFEPHLEFAVGEVINIFKDDEEILTGQKWLERVKEGLLYSKYLLAILSPSYFASKWCTYELKVIQKREKYLKQQLKKTQGLILPVRLSNPENFPDELKDIHAFDCSDYFSCAPIFRETLAYKDFEDVVKRWIKKEVAPLIKNAPEWDKAWSKFSKIKPPRTLSQKCDMPEME